ncbi:uncharacterized protein LOC123877655 isoform X2 [Maniola jurtina]|uniref:uncharacterized protein LOC123877655 isoform X2 n=1 Tax=Maniola jurtina TaxID=191418 RepID=UPI001E6865FA|nr:uncharacterized protein LOC123877655 isoform X2 [Maniola jurtina]
MNTAELQVNFLINASSALSQIQRKETQILRSHYLLKCSKLTGYSRLPQKHFSQETRCSRCLIEWTQKTDIWVKPIKLSKRQRRRIRSKGKGIKNKPVNKEYLLHSNIMEKVCSFCNHPTKTPIVKPNESYKHTLQENACIESPKVLKKLSKTEIKPSNINKYQSNVYCESKDAFSLSKQNTLSSHIKEPKIIIKNSKKKKDRFAGLCQTAVIAAAKIKQEKDKQNKLNLFLKPST